MNIGIIGAGNVGTTLGAAFEKAGHRVCYGVRDPASAKYAALSGVRTIREAVESSEVVLLATSWNGAQAALEAAGDFGGRPLLDATNPIGPGFVLTHAHTDSGGEQVARWARGARVVKAFNTTGVENMANPMYGTDRAAMFIAGDDPAARAVATSLARDLGFDAVEVGALSRARVLEPAAMLWITLSRSGRHLAFGLARRAS